VVLLVVVCMVVVCVVVVCGGGGVCCVGGGGGGNVLTLRCIMKIKTVLGQVVRGFMNYRLCANGPPLREQRVNLGM
jgi:hypothetical protein